MSDLPVEAKILSWIFEFRWLLYLGFWTICAAAYLLLRRNSVRSGWGSFIVSSVLFCVMQIGCVYCGWRFRMELRDRYAAPPQFSGRIGRTGFRWLYGMREADGILDVRLSRMPPDIRVEYAKHDYRPRYRDLRAMLAGFVPAVVILTLLQRCGAFVLTRFRK